MAFALRSLCMDFSVPYATNTRGFTGWFGYATDDAVATVIAAGYFNAARDKLAVGDYIDAICVISGTPDRVGLLVTAVPVAPGNITVAINTDASGG